MVSPAAHGLPWVRMFAAVQCAADIAPAAPDVITIAPVPDRNCAAVAVAVQFPAPVQVPMPPEKLDCGEMRKLKSISFRNAPPIALYADAIVPEGNPVVVTASVEIEVCGVPPAPITPSSVSPGVTASDSSCAVSAPGPPAPCPGPTSDCPAPPPP